MNCMHKIQGNNCHCSAQKCTFGATNIWFNKSQIVEGAANHTCCPAIPLLLAKIKKAKMVQQKKLHRYAKHLSPTNQQCISLVVQNHMFV